MKYVIGTFYKFVHLPDYKELRDAYRALCEAHDMRGTILLAKEGINGTIAGQRATMDAVLAALRADSRLADLETKESFADFLPFKRMKVRLKREIVTLRSAQADPFARVGTYVEPSEWNELISDPEVMVIDTRNDFEVTLGSFQGAVSPDTESFHDFPSFVGHNLHPAKHKKIAMFCTGGIRCEKATSYMLAQGFEEVYHLKGGVLKYLEEIPPEESLWRGECFVFDDRVSVDHHLQVGQAHFCPTCKTLLPDDGPCPNCSNA